MYPNGDMLLGGSSYPHAAIVCNNCANTKLLNAVIISIMGNKVRGKGMVNNPPNGLNTAAPLGSSITPLYVERRKRCTV